MKWFTGHMPDITPAQVIAALTWVVGQAIAWGWIDNDAGQQFVSVATTVVSGVWMAVDAALRYARNKRLALEAANGVTSAKVAAKR